MRAERLQTSGSGTRRRELASRTALSISCSSISDGRSGGEGARDGRLVTGAFQDAQRWTMGGRLTGGGRGDNKSFLGIKNWAPDGRSTCRVQGSVGGGSMAGRHSVSNIFRWMILSPMI